jgi:dihydroxyacetone kinase phosphotransfer subunit
MTVGIVLVSHSERLAEGIRELAGQMAPDVAIAAAGGMDDGGVGTSFDRVTAALDEADSGDGVVVLYDLGSAQMTADLALEMLDDERRARVVVADAPLVEGAIAAATTAQGGASVGDVAVAASAAWGRGVDAEPASDEGGGEGNDEVRETAILANPLGIHARPAALIVKAAAEFDAEIRVGPPGAATADARSVLSVVSLGLGGGAEMEVVASGPQAREAVDRLVAMAREGFGES